MPEAPCTRRPLCIHPRLDSLWSPSGRCCCRNISSSRRGRGGPGGGSPAGGRRSNLRAAGEGTGRHLSHTGCGPAAHRPAGRQARGRDPGHKRAGGRRLTHDEALCLGELAEQFPEVLVALFVCGTQHLPRGLGHGSLSADRSQAPVWPPKSLQSLSIFLALGTSLFTIDMSP